MPREHITPLYTQRFQCIGGQCEDSCCAVGWYTAVDKEHYKKLKKVMDHSKRDRDHFRNCVKRTRSPHVSEQNYASLQMRPDGRCFYLGNDGFCELHATYGPKMLPHTCAVYPRSFNVARGRLEMSGTLSCPEMARQCLLAEDAMTLVEYDPEVLPYKKVFYQSQVSPTSDNYYEKYLDDIRSLILNLLLERHYPLRTRLFFTAYFAKRTSDFYHRAIDQEPVKYLESEMAHITNPEILSVLHQQFLDMEVPNTLGMTIIQTICLTRTQKDSIGRYNQLLADILAHYQQGAEVLLHYYNVKVTLSAQDLFLAYHKRRKCLEKSFGNRIDLIFTNYCCNYWFKEWFTASPDLMIHLRKLLVRIAILRFLFYSHPMIKKLAEGCADDGDIELEGSDTVSVSHQNLIDKAAIEVFYIFSRAIEHNSTFLKGMDEALDDNDIKSLAHMVFLIQF